MPNKMINQLLSPRAMFIALLIYPLSTLAGPPYPNSPLINGINWNFSSPKTRIAPDLAIGSDIWPTTWAADGNLYTGWGDGGGFGGTNTAGRVTIGVGVIRGTPEALNASNIWGGLNPTSPATFDGKPGDLLGVNGKIYMPVQAEGTWDSVKMCESSDFAVSWNCTSWSFKLPGAKWSSISFLQFGMDYAGARDNFVYIYTHKDGNSTPRNILLGRVPKDQLMTQSSYEFFSGFDSSQNPTWSPNPSDSKPIFTNPDGVYFGTMVTYQPSINRYIMTVAHNQTGGWGMYDSVNPWGPWTTVFYTDQWLDSEFKFAFGIPRKWVVGNNFVMIFSGINKYDDWNTVAGEFILGLQPKAPVNFNVN